jgi:hypothetical protein
MALSLLYDNDASPSKIGLKRIYQYGWAQDVSLVSIYIVAILVVPVDGRCKLTPWLQ